MCEPTAYLFRNGMEEPIVEGVETLEVDDGQVTIISLFGEERKIAARIKILSLVDHKIILEPI